MKDYLNKLCDNLNIKLVYSDDEYIALSAGINSSLPFIRANSIFVGCPEAVAKAIMGYYTEPQHEIDFLKVITDYLDDNVVTVEYSIQPPDETFKDVLRHIDKNGKKKEPAAGGVPKKPRAKRKASGGSKAKKNTSTQKISGEDPSLVELDISSITKKNFYGGVSNIKPDESISASSDDVIELDIQVDDSKI